MSTDKVNTTTAKPERLEGTVNVEGSHDARLTASVILDVLTGLWRPAEAAQALSVSLPRYYALETRALQGFVAALEPRTRGPGRRLETIIAELTRDKRRLEQEVSRKQTLIRLSQRVIGVPALDRARGKDLQKNGKRRRRIEVRAQRAAKALRKQASAPAAPATAESSTVKVA